MAIIEHIPHPDTALARSATLHRNAHLCIAIPHVQRPENYLRRTLRSLIKNDSSADIVVVVCDFSAEPSASLKQVVDEFAQSIESGHLMIESSAATGFLSMAWSATSETTRSG